jgi:hypothetical protein
MRKTLWTSLLALVAVGVFSTTAYSDTIDVGYVAFDVSNPPLAEVDIVNLTGANAFPPSFPVTSDLDLTDLDLTVNFATGACGGLLVVQRVFHA